MKEKLQEIHGSINNIFSFSLDSVSIYKRNIEEALELIRTIPFSHNVMLENWKAIAISELQKELDNRFSNYFNILTPDEQKAEFKFSKITVTNILMNIIMNL
jgi:hypothetical protein